MLSLQIPRTIHVAAASILVLAPLAPAQLATGTGAIAEVWATNCANCHGARGEGGGAGTSTLLGDEPLSVGGRGLDRGYFEAIKHGLPEDGMAAFGETMPDAQIWALVAYIRELQHRDMRQRLGSPEPDGEGVYSSDRHRFRIETVVDSGLSIPWSVELLPDGRMLIAERPGTLRVHSTGRPGGELSGPIAGTPEVLHRGQGGLMDIALHPEFERNGWIYISFADALSDGRRAPNMTKLVRGRIKEDGAGTLRWTDEQTIFQADPDHYIASGLHFGCRIDFSPEPAEDGRYSLFFSIGERGRGDDAQDLTVPNGKVHRIYDDGGVPGDNPFASAEDKAKGRLPTIWTYGNRNPQGLTFDTRGNLWITEHGPRGGDELNLVLPGRNYGWPLVTFGMNYNGAPLTTPWPAEDDPSDIAMPIDRWLPSIGACGLTVARGPAFEHWAGDLLAGGLSGQNVDRIRIASEGGELRLAEREELIHGLGRVRDVVCAPDGTIYVVLNGPDKVVRLTPVEGE